LRKIIFHYHLFKNAGTSLDVLLKKNFPNSWVSKEFTGTAPSRREAVISWILKETNVVSFSSHTAAPLQAEIENIEVFPISFVRHPIDRIASAYTFERKQGYNTFGPTLARNTSLGGYIDIQLSLGYDSQCRNFLLQHFSSFSDAVTQDRETRAVKVVDTLPFIGLVEEYAESIEKLATWLKPHFPEFQPIVFEANVTRDVSVPLDEWLSQIRQEIGPDLYQKVTDANKADFMLYERVKQRYTVA
jgi:hypothetical protein